MTWDNKVVWSEGLFLQPHHFQQADRYAEGLAGGVARYLSSYGWGFAKLEIDEDLLRLGKIAISACAGLTPDHAPFHVPQSDDHPAALDVPAEIKNCVVLLAVPARRHGGTEVDMSGADRSSARFLPREVEVSDAVGVGHAPATIAVARTQLHFALEVDDLSGQLTIPVARIIERRQDGEIVLDRGFIPSVIDVRAAPALYAFLREVEGLLAHRAEALAGRLSDAGSAKGAAENADFMLLLAINRALPQIRHLLSIENLHPCMLYCFLAGLTGELCTFMTAERRMPELAAYDHSDLAATFQPIMRHLRQYLSTVLEQTALGIPLEPRKYGVHVAMIADKRLLTGATFVIAVSADVPPEAVRRHFPNQAKLGPVESIRQLVNSALPGIGVRPLPVAPRQIPYHAGLVYFELDRESQYWKQMTSSGGLAVFVTGEFPGISMELWAIRDS
ncbi:MAG: type VI secretion system baseplate subunit TssK [Pseudomonadota bacterium]